MKSLSEQLNDHLEVICEMLGTWLKDMGGYSNGYGTEVEGYVTQRVYLGKLSWETPTSHTLSDKEKEQRGAEINKQIREYLEEHDLPEIHINSKHIFHGVSNIYVGFVLKNVVRFD